MREYAARGGFQVLGVDYALSPEAKFPVALEQVIEVVGWLAETGEGLGIRPQRLAIGGDSAGANLALAAALALRDRGQADRLCAMLLNYGAFDVACSDVATGLYGSSVLTSDEMTVFWDNYLRTPPQRAVWIPADLDHEIYVRGRTSLRSLYVTASALHTELTRPRVIEVSRFLKELLLEAANMPVEYDLQGREGRIMDLILDEITSTRDAPLEAPMPADRRLVRVCTAILRDPSQTDMLEDWAKQAGMGRRTFTRLFREDGREFCRLATAGSADGSRFASIPRAARHHGRVRRGLQQPKRLHSDVPAHLRHRAEPISRLNSGGLRREALDGPQRGHRRREATTSIPAALTGAGSSIKRVQT